MTARLCVSLSFRCLMNYVSIIISKYHRIYCNRVGNTRGQREIRPLDRSNRSCEKPNVREDKITFRLCKKNQCRSMSFILSVCISVRLKYKPWDKRRLTYSRGSLESLHRLVICSVWNRERMYLASPMCYVCVCSVTHYIWTEFVSAVLASMNLITFRFHFISLFKSLLAIKLMP